MLLHIKIISVKDERSECHDVSNPWHCHIPAMMFLAFSGNIDLRRDQERHSQASKSVRRVGVKAVVVHTSPSTALPQAHTHKYNTWLWKTYAVRSTEVVPSQLVRVCKRRGSLGTSFRQLVKL